MPASAIPTAATGRRSWWRRIVDRVFRPHVFVHCAHCGSVLGEPTQPWRRGERRRPECFGRANIAGPDEQPIVVCIRLEHVRWYA